MIKSANTCFTGEFTKLKSLSNINKLYLKHQDKCHSTNSYDLYQLEMCEHSLFTLEKLQMYILKRRKEKY